MIVKRVCRTKNKKNGRERQEVERIVVVEAAFSWYYRRLRGGAGRYSVSIVGLSGRVCRRAKFEAGPQSRHRNTSRRGHDYVVSIVKLRSRTELERCRDARLRKKKWQKVRMELRRKDGDHKQTLLLSPFAEAA